MPQLTARFGPIPASVTLDGSGNGTATFQPNGSNARITNLFVKVATAVNQAVCTIYRGQIGDMYAINTTQSGSTGAAATGIIDVQDGETLYIVWTGGDPGAIATATLIGTTVPFDQLSLSTQVVWDNPIVAGDGSLIFPAIHSPDYVTGVSGWTINRDGTVEFAEGTFRGELIVSNASGAYLRALATGVLAEIQFQAPDSISGRVFGPTYMYAESTADYPTFQLIGPTIQSPFFLQSGTLQLSMDPGNLRSTATIDADYTSMGSSVHTDSTANLDAQRVFFESIEQGKGWITGIESVVDTAAITAETVVLTLPSALYRANRAFRIVSEARYVLSAAVVTTPLALWKKGTTTAGFNLIDMGRFDLPANGSTFGRMLGGVFVTGANDVTTQICMTLSSPGTAVTQKGTTGAPRRFEIFDIGPSSRYPNAVQLT